MKRQGIYLLSTFVPLLEGGGDTTGTHLASTIYILQPKRVQCGQNTEDSQNYGATFSLGLNLDILSF